MTRRGDELDIRAGLFELPESHEFGAAYDPRGDPESTPVATAEVEFVRPTASPDG